MSSLFILPFTHAFLPNGSFAGGSRLTFYRTGTTTLATIIDEDGDPLPNPITADAFGIFPTIFLQDDAVYRVVLTDINGNILNQLDPIPSLLNGPIRIGKTDLIEQQFQFTEQIAQAAIGSSSGNYALVLWSQTADNPNPGSMSTTPLGLFVRNNNDNQVSTAYAQYIQFERYPGTGTCQGIEINAECFTESGSVGAWGADGNTLTLPLWITSGRDDYPAASFDVSCGMALVSNSSGNSRFKRGLVIQHNAIADTFGYEAITMADMHNIRWYNQRGYGVAAIGGQRQDYRSESATGAYTIAMQRASATGGIPPADSAMGVFETYVVTNADGTNVKNMGGLTFTSRGNADHGSIDLQPRNTAGNFVGVSMGLINNAFTPTQNQIINLGDPNLRFGRAYIDAFQISGSMYTFAVDGDGFVKATEI
jgi:hypothetical protein